jgi:hypothetical protein
MTELAELQLLGASALASLHAEALPQKDEFCGPFFGALALRAFGIDDVDGEPADQDLVAREALTTRWHGDPYASLPPGEQPRVDYRLALPNASDAGGAGTNAPQLGRAIERVAGGRLAVVPVAGPWTDASVVTLLESVHAQAPETILIANVRTGRFWRSKTDPALLFAVLAGERVEGLPSEWDAGHFVSLAFLLRGPAGCLVGVRDTYRSLGWNGTHLQPASAVAAALERGDGRGGGVLCVCRAAVAPTLRERLEQAAFTLAEWDNGSVPADASH